MTLKPRTRTWLQILKDSRDQLITGDINMVAGSLAFSTVLSLFPFLALTLVSFQMIGGLEFLYPKVQEIIFRTFQTAVGDETSAVIRRVIERIKPGTLGPAAAGALLFTTWRMMQDIFIGIQRMWERKKARPLLRRFIFTWGLVLVFILGLAVWAGFKSIQFFQPFTNLRFVGTDFILAFAGLFLLYKVVPDTQVRNRSAASGALIACLGISILQGSFTWLGKKVFNFSRFYGGLAAIPLFLFWILFIWYIILFGAAVAAGIQKNIRSREKITEVP